MSRVVHIKNEEEWNKAMSESRSFGGKAVLVDFMATWCGPCKAIAPILDKLSNEFTDVTFLKVDVDELQGVAAGCGVRAMPTFIGFFNGEQVDTVVGADQAKLRALLQTLSSKVGPGAGHKLGGGDSTAAAAASQGEDTPEARRARMLAAAEARSKGAQ